MDSQPSDPRLQRIAGRSAALVLAGFAAASIAAVVAGAALGGFIPASQQDVGAALTIPHAVSPVGDWLGGALIGLSVLLTVFAPLAGLIAISLTIRRWRVSLVWFSVGTVAVSLVGILLAR